MDITDIIPESLNDLGAIVFWIIIFILIIAVVALYLYARRMSKKVVKMQENLDTHLNITKKSKEKRMQELSDVKNKVDKILEEEKK
jgi:predicted Holliday junction resolvase-like endonuclease